MTFFTAIWAALTSRIGRYAAAIAAVLAILLAAYRKGGKDQQAKQAQTRLKEIRKAKDVEDEIDRRSDDDVRRDLDKWMRD